MVDGEELTVQLDTQAACVCEIPWEGQPLVQVCGEVQVFPWGCGVPRFQVCGCQQPSWEAPWITPRWGMVQSRNCEVLWMDHDDHSSTETQKHDQGHTSPLWTPTLHDIAAIWADPRVAEVLGVLAQDTPPKTGLGGVLED